MRSNLERVLEHVVDNDLDLAKSLLHEYFITNAREIFAVMEADDNDADMDDDADMDISDTGNDFADDIVTDEDDDDDDSEAEVDGAFVNVEDAIDELRAAFADLVADDDDMDDDADDDADGADMDDMDMDMDTDMDMDDVDDAEDDLNDSLEENAKLSKVAVAAAKAQANRSPVGPGPKTDRRKAVGFGKGSEAGRKAPTAKDLGISGPQKQGGKLKKVSTPAKAKAVKSKSLFN
jgi:hypothetical protein